MATKKVKVRVIVERSTVYEKVFNVPEHAETDEVHDIIEKVIDKSGVEGWDEFDETTFGMKIDEIIRVRD